MDTCILCKSTKKDDYQYGDFLKKKNVGVHTFCLYLSSNLSQNGEDDEGFLGFLEADIKKEVNRVQKLTCFYCHKRNANIGCCHPKCRRNFHLICGINNFCENQFCHNFRSFCHQHKRKVQQRPSPGETCLICYENLCARNQFNTSTMIQTPCCRNGWFHKFCLQKFAKTSGYFFKCPLCNDTKVFRGKLPWKGIFIPNQDAAWELEPNAFAELLERPSECAALQCVNRQGRKAVNPNNPFVMCSTCGSTAMHKQCLPNGDKRFHCADCTIAIEEADSGRESLNSQQQNPANDIEIDDIDVCSVSDKEDLEIVRGLLENTEKSKCNTRDSGLPKDHEETNRRQLSKCKTRRIKSDTESSEEMSRRDNNKPQHSRQLTKCKTRRIRSETESSEEMPKRSKSTKTKLFGKTNRFINYSDSSSEEEAENIIITKTKQLTRDLTSSSNEVVVKQPILKRALALESDDTEDEQMVHKINRLEEKNSKKCEKSNFIDDDDSDSDDEGDKMNKMKNISIVSIESSENDDPLENFTKIMEKQKNISCIALRTRKSQNMEKSQEKEMNNESLTKQTNNIQTTVNQENLKTPQNKMEIENIQTKSVMSKEVIQKPKQHTNEKSNSRHFEALKDERNAIASNSLDISCIAKRTRRKSMACMPSNSRQEKETATTSSLNISCIAVRTRRRTICAQSTKEHFQMSQIFEKLDDSESDESDNVLENMIEENKEDEEEDEEEDDEEDEEEDEEEDDEEDEEEDEEDDEEDEEATELLDSYKENEQSNSNDSNDFTIPEGYEQNDTNFDISCIANRTRRKFSNGRPQPIYEIDDTICYSVSSTINSTASSSSSANTTSRTLSTSSSSTCSSLSSHSDPLYNVKLGKRRSKRFMSFASSNTSSSTSISSPSPYKTRYTLKSKIYPTRLMEKFPSQNFTAFLNTKNVSTKSSCNSALNYYPNNQYHPHSNNHKRV